MKKLLALLAVAALSLSLKAQSVPTYVVLPPMTYAAATSAAEALGGHLAFIQSVDDYLTLVGDFEPGTTRAGTTYFLGIQSGDLGFNWTNTDGTESFLNVWGGAFHIGSPRQPTGPDQVVTLRKFYSLVNHRVVYKPGLLVSSAFEAHPSIVEIE